MGTNGTSSLPCKAMAHFPQVLTADGLKEYSVQEIINSCRRGQGWQFLVCWLGYGPQHDLWIAASELNECEAPDVWYKLGGNGPDAR